MSYFSVTYSQLSKFNTKRKQTDILGEGYNVDIALTYKCITASKRNLRQLLIDGGLNNDMLLKALFWVDCSKKNGRRTIGSLTITNLGDIRNRNTQRHTFGLNRLVRILQSSIENKSSSLLNIIQDRN